MVDLLEVGVALGGSSRGGCAGYAVAVLGLVVSLGVSLAGAGGTGDVRWSFWGFEVAQRELGGLRELESLSVKLKLELATATG